MKTTQILLLLTTFALLVFTITSKINKSQSESLSNNNIKQNTPKGFDLKNHFGTPNVGSTYGPTTDYSNHVENNPDTYSPQRFAKTNQVAEGLKYHPSKGDDSKFNPHHVKAGDFTNIASSASKIINPEITGPKVHIQAEVEYPSNVKVPTFYGFKKEFKPVTAYDRLTGKDMICMYAFRQENNTND